MKCRKIFRKSSRKNIPGIRANPGDFSCCGQVEVQVAGAEVQAQERAADAAGRASQRVKMAELFSGFLGERFSGVISGCASYGVFVTLDDTCAEGLVPVRSLGDEWFAYDEARMTLTGEESGEVWGLGRRVAVEVTGADPARGRIDFSLARDGRPRGDARRADSPAR